MLSRCGQALQNEQIVAIDTYIYAYKGIPHGQRKENITIPSLTMHLCFPQISTCSTFTNNKVQLTVENEGDES